MTPTLHPDQPCPLCRAPAGQPCPPTCRTPHDDTDDTCACGEDLLTCPTCANESCRDHQCPEGPAPCTHQQDERAHDDAVERQVADLRGH